MFVMCNSCKVNGQDYTFNNGTYALPLLSMEPCSHMFCIDCIITMQKSSSSSLLCVVCKSNGNAFQNYILKGKLLRFPVDLNSVVVYGKISDLSTDEEEEE
ncbi:CG30 [Spodoptera litura nucleopolyhedrovirus II]|uniref:CG30 n=1 Tax=Spodoptera litura nucleopolyhedrovirus II TaxID=566270 RepID=UPI0001874633|nr:CG30 [Spodoptera litura nucleopolyhedrovirus II]ACI47456.1 CG30 [Spodoptera litura nucleopolyhedrovirus II]